MVERCLSLRGRRFLLMVIAVLFFMAFSHDAFAAEQGYGSFWYGPNNQTVSGVSYLKTGVVASTKYDAALYALGFGSSTVTGISNAKKNSLKANSTFSSFANKFVTGKPDDDLTTVIPGLPTVGLQMDSMLSAWYAARAMYGESNCFWSVYSADAAESAEDAAYKIIKGGTSSGGGSGGSGGSGGAGGEAGSDSTYVYFDTKINVFREDQPEYPYAGVAFPLSNYERIYNFLNTHNGYNLWIAMGGYADGNEKNYVTVRCINKEPNYHKSGDDGVWSSYNWVVGDGSSGTEYNGGTAGKTTTFQGKTYLVFSQTFNTKIIEFTIAGTDGCRPVYAYYWGGADVELPTEPPTDWPTTPTEPTVPPTPPDPVDPNPPTPWNPIPDIDIDITGDDFQDLLDALNEHCIHLQTSISSNISQLWSLQSDLFSDHMNTFWDNLHNDLLWLGECLNFDVNVNVDGGSGGDGGTEGGGEGDTNTYVPFDDTSVLYWLKQIWAKLPTGINTRPTDPVTNPDGWWDWLTQLLNNLAADLMMLGQDKLAGVLETLNELRSKFPFSLPWDVAALLGLLVGVPECPEFDMPCYTVSLEGLQQVGTYHITLEPYETVWEGVKWIETLAFAVYLITHTGGLMDMVTKTVRPR